MTKEEILNEVRNTAKENGGKPLGMSRFESITGITKHVWLRYWSRFSDIQRDAGFEPNRLNVAYETGYLLEKIINLIRELRAFPTQDEKRRKHLNDPDFPSINAFDRLGGKNQLIIKILTYCRNKPEYIDIVEILEPLAKLNPADKPENIQTENIRYGFVYLIKGHPGEYKIGRTNLVDRRLSELGAVASVEQLLIHEIKTDDPPGIEEYWHKRFQNKRMRGEWFKLSAVDIKAFKRWRRVF